MLQVQTKTKLTVQDFQELSCVEQQDYFLEYGLGFIREGSRLFESSYDLVSNVPYQAELLSSHSLLELLELIKDYCHIDFYFNKKTFKWDVTLYADNYYGSFHHYSLNDAIIVAFLILKGFLTHD